MKKERLEKEESKIKNAENSGIHVFRTESNMIESEQMFCQTVEKDFAALRRKEKIENEYVEGIHSLNRTTNKPSFGGCFKN